MNKTTCRLSELGEIVGGATPSTKCENFYGGDIPWITPRDLASLKGRYISKGEHNITEAGFRSCSTRLLPANSILFSSRAPIGYVAIAKVPLCTNQGFKSVIADTSKVDPLFLYYLLKANVSKIEAQGSGTTFKEVSGKVMGNIEVTIPTSLVHQRTIARILDGFDSKIEINKKINDNLSKLGRSLRAGGVRRVA